MTTGDSVEEIREEHRQAEAYDKEHGGKLERDELLLTDEEIAQTFVIKKASYVTSNDRRVAKAQLAKVLINPKQTGIPNYNNEQKGLDRPALTDWIYNALKEIQTKENIRLSDKAFIADRLAPKLQALIPNEEDYDAFLKADRDLSKRYYEQEIEKEVNRAYKMGVEDCELRDKKLDRPCPDCKGTGMGQFYFNKNAPCDTCKGTGKMDDWQTGFENFLSSNLKLTQKIVKEAKREERGRIINKVISAYHSQPKALKVTRFIPKWLEQALREEK